MTARPVAAVAVLAYPGVDELDLFGAYSVLAKAAAADAGVTVCLAARAGIVTGSGGVSFSASADLDAVRGATAVVVPGGRGAQDAMRDKELLDALRDAANRGAALYGVCSGVLLVAAAGLARHRRVAVHHAKRGLLAGLPVGDLVSGLVRDGPLCSVGGDVRESVKSADLAFALLADFAPHLVAPLVARMELRPGRGFAPAPGTP